MKYKKVIITYIIILIIFNLFVTVNRILWLSTEEKQKIISLYNIPINSKILLVHGQKGLFPTNWNLTLYYSNGHKIVKEVLLDDFEGTETHKFAVNLYSKNILKIIWPYELLFTLLIIIYLSKKQKGTSQ